MRTQNRFKTGLEIAHYLGFRPVTELVQQCNETRSIGQKLKLAIMDQLLLWVWVAFHRWPPNGRDWLVVQLSGC